MLLGSSSRWGSEDTAPLQHRRGSHIYLRIEIKGDVDDDAYLRETVVAPRARARFRHVSDAVNVGCFCFFCPYYVATSSPVLYFFYFFLVAPFFSRQSRVKAFNVSSGATQLQQVSQQRIYGIPL